MARRGPKISPRHALTKPEERFCRVFAAFGETNAAEAYRRSFLVSYRGKDYEPDENTGRAPRDKEGNPTGKPLTAKAVGKKATALLAKDYIQGYLRELGASGGERARQVLEEQAKLAESTDARRAAEKILEQEDKHGFRGAVERFWDITCEAGATLVVPLPERFVKDFHVPCEECGHVTTLKIDEQIEITVAARDMFGGGEDDDGAEP